MEKENEKEEHQEEDVNADAALQNSESDESKAKEAARLAEEEEEKDLANIVTAEEYLLHKSVVLLEYERQMFLDLVHGDGLVVCAKGLHYDRVLLNILKAYSDAGNLVLVINSSDWEEEHYKSKLESKYVHEVANTAAERERVYLEGGIQFISTRILVVDLLKNRIPIELITGIVVMRAHTVIESCQEAFALRLYRQQNKTGFIKAFSSSAGAFTIGYGHIERIMRNLFVKELYIWPRFHAIVQAALKPYEPQTIELHVPMSSKMTLIQTHIFDIMNYLVREIKRINPTVDMEEITVENCLAKKFHKILQAQLDCIWHQLNSQTKLIVADLKILRNLMISTVYSDAVAAYALTKRYRATEYAINNSGWTLLDSAEQIFKLSKERVYNAKGEFEPEFCPKWKYLTEILKVEIPADMKRSRPDCSDPPKVLVLCQDTRACYQLKQYLLQGGERFLLYAAMRHEVPIGKLSQKYEQIQKNTKELEDVASQQSSNSNSNRQSVNRSSATSTATATVSTSTLSQKLAQSQNLKRSNSKARFEKGGQEEDSGIVEVDELKQLFAGDKEENLDVQCFAESYMLTMTQVNFDDSQSLLIKEEGEETDVRNEDMKTETMSETTNADASIFEPFPELDDLDVTAAVMARKQPLICIQTFKTEREGAMALERILNEINPQYVIMYHCNVTAIRQLEIFEARQRRPAKDRLKVFFLIHNRTVEEQSYLHHLRREKQIFEHIINTKETMVIPEYQDGKTDEAFVLYKNFQDPEDGDANNASSRKAGGQEAAKAEATVTPKIIVDMREFRSDLPCLIHKRGIEVVPVTISIGDYILTPEICVERKSISDLIGSLNSGRLYNQCIQMQRNYAKPILLIEFDQNRPFHLQGKFMLSHNTTSTNANIMQKLQLLTLHFPKLRLIWSPNPYATSQIFEELKQGKEEPDARQAAAVGTEELGGGAYEELKYNPNIYDFLLRLPGVTTRNIHKLMRNGGSFKELLKKSQAELSDLLESMENGRMLWDILHVAHLPEKDEVQGSAALLAAGRTAGAHSRFRRGAAAAATAAKGRVLKR